MVRERLPGTVLVSQAPPASLDTLGGERASLAQDGGVDMKVVQLSGAAIDISDETLLQFRAALRGPVLTREDLGYEEASVVWNNHFADKRPAIIAKCAGSHDVVDAVNFASQHSLLTAIRCGGHSTAGYSTNDGGLVIDLTLMRGVWLDPEHRVVRVQGGAEFGDVDRETSRVGLVVPGGVVSSTGVGGLALGGGVGWLHRKFGLTCDSLRSVEIVTADGNVLRASPTQHSDLFWAIRGGGGNFGVVTEFEFDAHELGPLVQVCGMAYQLDSQLPTLLRKWRDWVETIPEEVTTRVFQMAPPAAPILPPVLHDRETVFAVAVYAGPVDECGTVLEPIRNLAEGGMDLSGVYPFRDVQRMFDIVKHGEQGGYWKSTYVDRLDDDLLEIVVKRITNKPGPIVTTQLLAMGGAVGRLGGGETAFGDRVAPYLVSAEAVWKDPAIADDSIRWSREFIAEVEALGYARGTYLNFNSDSDLRSRGAQFGENLARLSRVKKQYDPDNVFRVNNNIPPVG
jgi:FAD/FMN-containing dehydrogenase